MTPERWQRVADAFEAALELNTEQRNAFLAKLSSDDPSLRNEVEALLAEDALQAKAPPGAADTETIESVWQDPPVGAAAHLTSGVLVAGRYEILSTVDEGGMGTVYKCRDRELDRVVALKVIRPSLANQPDLLRRFKQELILARQVTHRNVIRIFDLGADDSVRFITMEYVEGRNLASVLRENRRLRPEEAARIVAQVCRALEAAHAEKIVHRGLKPQNIMVDAAGKVTVMDFGIARAVDSLTYTRTGALIGTPAYMSPEQARGNAAGPASDLFSLGVVFYEILTGTHPFRADDMMSSLLRRIEGKFVPPSELDPTLPPELSTVVVKSLALDPDKRYASAAEMRRAIEAWQVKAGLAESDVAALPAARSRLKRYGTAILLAAAGAVGVLWWGWSAKPPPQPKTTTLLVSDFDNATSDAVFSGTLESALSISLESAPFINLFDRAEAHRVASQIRNGNAGLDASTARLVAVRQGLGAVVAGSLQRAGNRYLFEVHVLEPLSGKLIMHAEERTPDKQRVLAAAGQMAVTIRRALGDRNVESVGKSVAETFTSASIEAAHAYAAGQEFGSQGHWAQAIQSYRQAIEIDAELGRAYAGLALAYENQGERQQAEMYYRLAMARVDRMTDREKYRTLGGYYLMRREYPKAAEQYQSLLARYPADLAAPTDLALAYFYQHDFRRALTQGNRAVESFPDSLIKRNNAGLFALFAGDFQQASGQFRMVLKVNSSYAKAELGSGLAQLAQGLPDEAAEDYLKLKSFPGSGPSLASIALADLALYEGQAGAAMSILEAGIQQDEDQKRVHAAAIKLVTLACAQLSARHRAKALKSAERALSLEGNEGIEGIAYPAAQIFLRTGHREKAATLARSLAQGLAPDSRAYAQIIQGEISLDSGSVADALKFFEGAQHEADTWLGRLDLGIAYLRLSKNAEAYTELEECLKRRSEALSLFLDDIPTYRFFPDVYYYLGRAQEGLNSPAAAESFRTFLTIKSMADPDPLVEDARKHVSSR